MKTSPMSKLLIRCIEASSTVNIVYKEYIIIIYKYFFLEISLMYSCIFDLQIEIDTGDYLIYTI